MKFRMLLATGLAAAALAIPSAAHATTPAHPAEGVAFYSNGAWHPFGNPHWCFNVNVSERTAIAGEPAIIIGEQVMLDQCATLHKHPVADQYWWATKVRGIGQMGLEANPHFVLGMLHEGLKVCMVPSDPGRSWYNWLAFMQDKHGNWEINITSLHTKKTFFATFPEHLKAGHHYPIKWNK